MTLEITLPWTKKGSVEGLVFTILSKEYPLRLIDLMNFIRKRYGKSVTFQAVRKSVLQLIDKGVLVETKHKYQISKEWVLNSKKLIDELHEEIIKDKSKTKTVESIKGEVSVFTFNSIKELMNFWQDIIDDWYKNINKSTYKVNCHQAAHVWEILLLPEIEKKVMHQLKQKNIKSYSLTTSNTLLDRQSAQFYKKLGIINNIASPSSNFDKSYYVATYGDLIVQTQYPQETVKLLDDFYKKTKSLKDVDLIELSNIVNKKVKCKLTVIKNLAMAKQINKSIISQIN